MGNKNGLLRENYILKSRMETRLSQIKTFGTTLLCSKILKHLVWLSHPCRQKKWGSNEQVGHHIMTLPFVTSSKTIIMNNEIVWHG